MSPTSKPLRHQATCILTCDIRQEGKLAIPSEKYDVAEDSVHLVDAGRFVDSFDDRRQQIRLETGTTRPLHAVILPLQQTVKSSRCIPHIARGMRQLVGVIIFTSQLGDEDIGL